jgi:hypothetical protein
MISINISTYLNLLLQFANFFPLMALCYFPMRHQLRFSTPKNISLCTTALLLCTFLCPFLCLYLNTNLALVLAAIPMFFVYHYTVKADWSRSLVVYTGNYMLITFTAQFSFAYDAWRHPESSAVNFSLEASVFRILLSVIFALVLFYPYQKWYSWLIDNLLFPKIWYPMLVLNGIIFVFNLLMFPSQYQTLYTGRTFVSFLALEIIILLFSFFLHVIFYQIALFVMEYSKLEVQSNLLEIQSTQYHALQNYMEQTSRLRHDFRHYVHILNTLAEQGNWENIKQHLQAFEQQLDTNAPAKYCSDAALNALFNYYHELAASSHITTNWKIELPESSGISQLDLASLFGNLMENAIDGCLSMPEEQRYFALSTQIKYGEQLYIVSTNSFDGYLKKTAHGYATTKQNGSGIGTLSITAISEKYHGYTNFSNNEKEFFVDIMLNYKEA